MSLEGGSQSSNVRFGSKADTVKTDPHVHQRFDHVSESAN
jgi:hypothetical protein